MLRHSIEAADLARQSGIRADAVVMDLQNSLKNRNTLLETRDSITGDPRRESAVLGEEADDRLENIEK